MRLALSTKEKIDFLLRHPLTLSLTGMLLGSLLIPWIVGRSSKQAAVADTRLKQALQVMATSNGVDATINKIETAFEGFNSAFSFPQLCEMGAGGYGRLHVLHRNPFERTMRVVLTAKQIWGWKAELGQA